MVGRDTSPTSTTMSRGVLLVCLAGIAWGTAPIAFSYAYDGTNLSPLAISAHRLGNAAVVLIAVALICRQVAASWAALRTHPAAMICLGVGLGAYQVLWFAAIPQVGASVATVLSLGLAPVIVTAWERTRDRTLPRPAEVAVLAGALVGLGLVSFSAEHGSAAIAGRTGLGVGLAVSAGIVYAASTLLSRHLATRCAALPLTTATTTISACAIVPIAAFSGPMLVTNPTALAALLYLGAVTMALGYLALYLGLRHTPASTAAIATLLEPVTATVLAVALLGERLPAPALAGILLILGAVVALNRRARSGGASAAANDNDFL